jgi:2,6-dihydroxypseudooxynicotine hydrolase
MENKDPRVTSAAQHWAHRMVTNGVPLADFQDVTGGITTWDQWLPAWVEKGDMHRGLANEASGLTAAESNVRAALCYHFAKFLFVHDPEAMKSAHDQAVSAFSAALHDLDPPGERVAIPYEGHTLFGTLRKPRGAVCPPVVIMCMGLDSAKEEMSTNESVFLDRGMATLAFDGPGQGEAEYDLPIEPEYERPVAAVIDWIEQRDDLHPDRIGLWGVSLGGYYAPRAAAFEPRVRACISLTGPFDFAEAFDSAPPLTRAAFVARCHADSDDAARKVAARMSLVGVAERITCPLYVVGGGLDRVLPPDHAGKLADAAGGDVTLNMVDDGTHVVNNRPHKYRPQSADWMAANLRVR